MPSLLFCWFMVVPIVFDLRFSYYSSQFYFSLSFFHFSGMLRIISSFPGSPIDEGHITGVHLDEVFFFFPIWRPIKSRLCFYGCFTVRILAYTNNKLKNKGNYQLVVC